MTQKISTQPYKGARDFFPEDMRVRNYIANTWKRVIKSYGFEEYDFPIIEPFEIFAAKTGAEIVNEQLYSFEDRGGRKLAVRPELTPGTTRMISAKYKELPKPIRWFMIGNNWRAEKPQKGRGREFYQLEVNIFGEEGVEADFEIFSTAIDMMRAFGADEKMFTLLFSDRRLILGLLNDVLGLDENTATAARRLMDKRAKMEEKNFIEGLEKLGLNKEQAKKIEDFMKADIESLSKIFPEETLKNNKGYQVLLQLVEMLDNAELAKYCRFDPSIIRGFDYSDGLVYEVFDNSPENNRSMFGGERFDKLSEIFIDDDIPATGYAMGDWTLLEFLKAWDLLPKFENETEYLVTRWPAEDIENVKNYDKVIQTITNELRNTGKNVETYLDRNTKLDKQLSYANKKNFRKIVIVGEQELKDNKVTVKDMETGKQTTEPLTELISSLE